MIGGLALAAARTSGHGPAARREGHDARWSRAPKMRRSAQTRSFPTTFCRPLDRGARSELLHMMGLVAAVVAIVILVFFGLGYLFGRLFL